MFAEEFLWNVFLMITCYIYIALIIVVSGRIGRFNHGSRKMSRKFLHIMIGNLPLIIPFFTSNIYPTLVAAPFIFLTFLASPYSSVRFKSEKMKRLADITEEGHHLGLVFYAFSYTVLALLFASKPHIMSAGIMPMAYGDAFASIIGEKYGKKRFKLLANKSLEGSVAMFLFSSASFIISLAFSSTIYSFSFSERILSAVAVSLIATLAESFSPLGFDNVTVPASGALTMMLLDRSV